MFLVVVHLVVFAIGCQGMRAAPDDGGSEEKCVCNPVVNVGSPPCNYDGHMADLQTVLIAQQAHITRLQNNSKSSEKKITDSLMERVEQLEERIRSKDAVITCPARYELFKGACYRFSTDQKPYNESQHICHEEGGRLATVKTNETHNFLTNHVRATTKAHTWIGLSDVETEGLWVWDDGTLMVGDGIWGTNEPNGGTGENCVHFYHGAHNYRWNDMPCAHAFFYICEIRGYY
ncbi:alpha-N-acetylgalactosamine-specific lectin-like isoform X2 [Branchiostoma lanceolatum]|uniref:alpha-N-acetylgalactosamine-specific lectin-like isoform X2 n=1 Tax=Branchiostoma lanceolatum TaxID=7740 RepID=UPI0034542336